MVDVQQSSQFLLGGLYLWSIKSIYVIYSLGALRINYSLRFWSLCISSAITVMMDTLEQLPW